MEPPEDVNTTLRTPASRDASSRLTVPATLSRMSRCGSETLMRTSICAARWQITSGRTRPTSSVRPGSVMSNCSKENRSEERASARFSSLPRERSSSPTTSWPSASRVSQTLEPMNPAAPVTRMRTTRQAIGGHIASRRRPAGLLRLELLRLELLRLEFGGAPLHPRRAQAGQHGDAQRLGRPLPTTAAGDEQLDLLLDAELPQARRALVEMVPDEPLAIGVDLPVEVQVHLVEDVVTVRLVWRSTAHCDPSREPERPAAAAPASATRSRSTSSGPAVFAGMSPRSRAYSSSSARRPRRPRCSRDITVPMGVPMISAISL